MPTAIELYSVADVVDKTLYAKTKCPVYHTATDSAQPFGYVAAGQPVGVVYSWLDPSPAYDRTTLWWMFAGATGGFYFAKQVGGMYDVDALRAQGVITVTEKAAEEEEKKKLEEMGPIEALVYKYGKWVLIGGVAIAATNGLIKKL